jgi:hypothetical protein
MTLRRSIAAGSLTVLAFTAGCGGSDSTSSGGASTSPTPTDNGVAALSASQILSRARTALQSAPSIRVKGSVVNEGARLTIDLRASDKGGRATITQTGQTIEVLRIGTTVYVKADADFWRAQTRNTAAAELLKGKYLKGSTSDAKLASIAELTDMDKFVGTLLTPKGTVQKGPKKTVRGTEAIALDVSGQDGGTLYVATRGQPYPLQIVSTTASEPGTIDFLDYGVPVPLTPPPAEQVVDTSKLGGS